MPLTVLFGFVLVLREGVLEKNQINLHGTKTEQYAYSGNKAPRDHEGTELFLKEPSGNGKPQCLHGHGSVRIAKHLVVGK